MWLARIKKNALGRFAQPWIRRPSARLSRSTTVGGQILGRGARGGDAEDCKVMWRTVWKQQELHRPSYTTYEPIKKQGEWIESVKVVERSNAQRAYIFAMSGLVSSYCKYPHALYETLCRFRCSAWAHSSFVDREASVFRSLVRVGGDLLKLYKSAVAPYERANCVAN